MIGVFVLLDGGSCASATPIGELVVFGVSNMLFDGKNVG